MATIYMTQFLAQLGNTEMYLKILFVLSKRVLNKFNDYFMTLIRYSIAHHKACVKSW